MALALMITLFPIFILVFTIWNRKVIKDNSLQDRFGSLYEGFKLDKLAHLLSNFLFTLRRLVLVGAVMMLSEYPGIQVQVFCFLSVLNLTYIMQNSPFETRLANMNEAFNECCILLASYILMMFTDILDDLERRDLFGYLLIGLFLGNFLANLFIQCLQILQKMKLVFMLYKKKFLLR
jgi:hypothetical protein